MIQFLVFEYIIVWEGYDIHTLVQFKIAKRCEVNIIQNWIDGIEEVNEFVRDWESEKCKIFDKKYSLW